MTTRNEVTRVTPKKEAFIQNYTHIGTVKGAAAATGVTRKTIYEWLKADSAFNAEFERAKEDVTDELEQEAKRRAYEGVDKPIYWQGKLVDTIKEYSDTLLIFLLKGNRPDKYRERSEHHLSGDVKVYHVVEE